MIFRLTQNRKELFSAQFMIERGAEKIGEVFVNGTAHSIEADICGDFCGTGFEMGRGKSRHMEGKAFRPYVLRQNKLETGSVYQTQYKVGFLKKLDIDRLVKNGMVYDLFSIAFGDEGSKNLVYHGNHQIAQIEKECVVYNDLHHYQVFAEDENAGLISLIFSMYMYINACYKPGVKASESCSKTISVTKDPCLLEKYDPDFKSKIQM